MLAKAFSINSLSQYGFDANAKTNKTKMVGFIPIGGGGREGRGLAMMCQGLSQQSPKMAPPKFLHFLFTL